MSDQNCLWKSIFSSKIERKEPCIYSEIHKKNHTASITTKTILRIKNVPHNWYNTHYQNFP